MINHFKRNEDIKIYYFKSKREKMRSKKKDEVERIRENPVWRMVECIK